MPDFLLPDLGEGLEDARVLAWHVGVGDPVAVDQVVVEVETAKAAVEVPVPFAGTVTTLHAAPGASVRVGRPLLSVTTDADASPPADSGFAPDAGLDSDAASGNVLVGYGTSPDAARPATRRGRRFGARGAAGPVPVLSPIVRRLARDADLDLATVAGSGPSGLVCRRDVERALRARAEPGATRIPLRGARRTAAERLARSRREIPEATVWVDVDATGLVAARAAMNAREPERPVSLLALLARFTVLALRRHPELNARLDGDEIVVPAHVHLGFAAQTDRGLVVPVVRDAHRLSVRELSGELAARTRAARAGRLGPGELTGGTITVNNYGVFGVDGSAAIINHPEVAIVGIGRVGDRPWVVDGRLAVRKVTQLTLAFDHRVCDGATAGGFLRYLADCVESPVTALADA